MCIGSRYVDGEVQNLIGQDYGMESKKSEMLIGSEDSHGHSTAPCRAQPHTALRVWVKQNNN